MIENLRHWLGLAPSAPDVRAGKRAEEPADAPRDAQDGAMREALMKQVRSALQGEDMTVRVALGGLLGKVSDSELAPLLRAARFDVGGARSFERVLAVLAQAEEVFSPEELLFLRQMVSARANRVVCDIGMDESSAQPDSAPRCRTCGNWTSTPCGRTRADLEASEQPASARRPRGYRPPGGVSSSERG